MMYKRVAHAEQKADAMEPIYRPRANSTQISHPLQFPANATNIQNTLSKPRRHFPHRFKQNSISSGTLFKHKGPVAETIEALTDDTSNHEKSQFNNHSVGTIETTTMLDLDRPRSRKDRTFTGGQCAACELPLENKLSGEKVLQFACGHVAHETCLYEYIKDDEEEDQFCPECEEPLTLDSVRGGNILDLNKVRSLVRSIAQAPSEMSAPPPPPPPKTPEHTQVKDDSSSTAKRPSQAFIHTSVTADRSSQGSLRKSATTDRSSQGSVRKSIPESKEGHLSRIEQLVGDSRHLRNSGDSSTFTQQPDEPSVDARKHDYDLSAMEGKLTHRDSTKNIPRPKVTIRSEFPTITRSAQQQSLTCLVTVEVPATRSQTRALDGHHPLSAPLLSSESPKALDAIASDLKARVENWHGLEVDKFGPLRLHANLKVGRDGTNWQKLDCFLFSELLICVREKKAAKPAAPNQKPPCQLKGSILIRKHLKDVQFSPDDLVLTLNLAVASLPTFRLKFSSREQLDVWRLALLRLDLVAPSLYATQDEQDTSGTEDEDGRRSSSTESSRTDSKTVTTAPTDYADQAYADLQLSPPMHVPVDFVVVIPVTSAMQGLKIKLLKDALRFLITNLGERDRMGLVTFGSNGGAMPLVGMATKDWYGWRGVYRSIRPVGQKSLRADPVEGATVALDLLSQRQDANPISSVLLISDSQAYETESLDFVVKRAQTSKTSIYSFGLGQTHKPDNLIELAARTNASYVYVKDWMMLRECVAGCLGALQSVSHVSAKLKLKIPEGSMAKFVKVSGALHTTKRTNGRDAEAVLGDLRFGDKRDILVQLSVEPDSSLNEDAPQDHWETIVSGLATLGGSLDDNEARPQSVEEVPLIQADLSFGDLAKEGAIAHLSHPSLLTIALLPASVKNRRTSRGSIVPPIPSHPSIVQRRMEMLTSDMLSRALTLMSKGQHESAHRLLAETRTILQGLGKGSLPALPSTAPNAAGQSRSSSGTRDVRKSPRGSTIPKEGRASPKIPQSPSGRASPRIPEGKGSNHSLALDLSAAVPRAGANIDPKVLHALDADIEACLEFIDHPAVFSHDARKAALQTIGVISSQRGYTFRTQTEAYWAARISGVQKMGEITKDWQMVGNDTLTETLTEEQ